MDIKYVHNNNVFPYHDIPAPSTYVYNYILYSGGAGNYDMDIKYVHKQ
jgi:hypothetical protein